MIGIYKDDFIDYLKKSLNISKLKITSKNIIIPCPWCEYGLNKDHYHLYLSLNAPIFNCFHAGCNESGFLTKLINKLSGIKPTTLTNFIDDTQIEKIKLEQNINSLKPKKNIILPEINSSQFPNKILYLKKRFKFSQGIDVEKIPGLIFDFESFLRINNIVINQYDPIGKMLPFIQNNFVGFITNKNSLIFFRNIDSSSKFSHYKYFIQDHEFLDYYKIDWNKNGKYILVGEGIFDIFSEYVFNFIQKKHDIKLYACSFTSNFQNLFKSIVFNEQIFKLNVLILADRGVSISYFEKIKKYNSHFIDSINIYYNKSGKDFNEFPVSVEEFII